MYPLSSRTEINRNKKAICGIKIKIPPTPGMIPSLIKLVSSPAGKWVLAYEAKFAKELSIKSIG